jgi:multisubunit Na+/H+ antiporter MnhG subunit
MSELKENLKTLGLPLALVAVIVALLAWVGLTVEELIAVVVALVGFQICFAFLVDVLKYAGVIKAGMSGKWSAAFNLIMLIGVAVWLKLFPTFDLYALDAQLFALGKMLGLIFVYITQILGTKAVHQVAVNQGVGVTFVNA